MTCSCKPYKGQVRYGAVYPTGEMCEAKVISTKRESLTCWRILGTKNNGKLCLLIVDKCNKCRGKK